MTTRDLLSDDEPEVALEDPEIPLDVDEPEIALGDAPEPEVAATETPTAVAPVALMQVLPADFPLPTLIRFVPDVRLRVAAEDAARYALSLEVRGAEGLKAADEALVAVRASQAAIVEHFAEPKDIAYRLHKSISSTETDWLTTGKSAAETVGRKVYAETQRLKALADEARRQAQAAADAKAREDAKRRAEEAARANAPKAVVENLTKQAETAKAAPVSTPATAAPPKLTGNTVTKKWTCTIAGTPRDAEQHPCMADLTPEQRTQVLELMVKVVAGDAPLRCFEIDWSYLKKRARDDEGTFNIPHLEAYDAGGIRAKGSRSK